MLWCQWGKNEWVLTPGYYSQRDDVQLFNPVSPCIQSIFDFWFIHYQVFFRDYLIKSLIHCNMSTSLAYELPASSAHPSASTHRYPNITSRSSFSNPQVRKKPTSSKLFPATTPIKPRPLLIKRIPLKMECLIDLTNPVTGMFGKGIEVIATYGFIPVPPTSNTPSPYQVSPYSSLVAQGFTIDKHSNLVKFWEAINDKILDALPLTVHPISVHFVLLGFSIEKMYPTIQVDFGAKNISLPITFFTINS